MIHSKHNKLNMTAMSKVMLIVLLDVVATAACFFFGLWARYDFAFEIMSRKHLMGYLSSIGIWCAITVAVLAFFKLYNCIWVFVGTSEVFRILGAYVVLAVIGVAFHLYGVARPRSSCIIGLILSCISALGIRFSYRFIKTAQNRLNHMAHASSMRNVMLIGAGDAGRALATEFVSSEYIRDNLVCVIDDNPNKLGKRLCGIPIVGNRNDITEMVTRYKISKIILAIPSASARTRKEILDICTTTGCEVQMLPGIYQMVNGEVSVSKLRNVDPQDLLGREPIRVNTDEIVGYVSGKVVLVTGGGGSIGSELCRQIAHANPAQLIILDIYENNAYDIQMELR